MAGNKAVALKDGGFINEALSLAGSVIALTYQLDAKLAALASSRHFNSTPAEPAILRNDHPPKTQGIDGWTRSSDNAGRGYLGRCSSSTLLVYVLVQQSSRISFVGTSNCKEPNDGSQRGEDEENGDGPGKIGMPAVKIRGPEFASSHTTPQRNRFRGSSPSHDGSDEFSLRLQENFRAALYRMLRHWAGR